MEDAGYECASYVDPIKVLQEFRPNYYDLILLDIKMPVLDGFELCNKIIEIDKNARIIFVTASGEYSRKIKHQLYPELSNNDNITMYIRKPIENQKLIKIVNEAIAKGNANKSAINSS